MRAVDTNVVIRLLTGDDAVQAIAARQVFAAGDVFVGVTVLLEAEWVLRAAYGFGPSEIARALRGLGGLPGVMVEDAAAVSLALDAMNRGIDFADALHLARAERCSVFVTFDRRLAGKAKGVAKIPVIVP